MFHAHDKKDFRAFGQMDKCPVPSADPMYKAYLSAQQAARQTILDALAEQQVALARQGNKRISLVCD